MSKSRHLSRFLLGLMLLTTLLFSAVPAFAQRSPGGMIDDRAGLLTAEQLANLESVLANRPFAYRVVILERAFPGEPPADEEARFQEQAHKLMDEVALPRDGVLISIALKEQLVDFRVRADGAVESAYRASGAGDFAANTEIMFGAFAVSAREGDIPGAISRSVDAIEQLAAPRTAPAPAPAPTPSTARPGTTTLPAQQPAPPPSEPVNPLYVGLGVGGLLLLGVVGFMLTQFSRYRRRHREALAIRDRFLEGLLKLVEQDLRLAVAYKGKETVQAVQAASEAADRVLQVYQEGTGQFEEAEQSAHRLRLGTALSLLQQARTAYEQAATAYMEAESAYAPVGEAVRQWEVALTAALANRESAEQGLATMRSRTGWGLEPLLVRWGEGAAHLQEGESVRDTDPVRAIRLAREGDAIFTGILQLLQRLQQQEIRCKQLEADRASAAGVVQESRQSLGLRFVESDPAEALGRAARQQEQAGRCMPEGDADGADQALQAGQAAVAEALEIVARYRKAVEQYPAKRASLSGGVGYLAGEHLSAQQVVEGLRQRFAPEDWADLKGLPAQIAALEGRIAAGLDEVARLTTPEVQRYLQSDRLLDGWLVELSQTKEQVGALARRPGELEERELKGREQLSRAQQEWEGAMQTTARLALLLPSNLEREGRQVESGLERAHQLLAARPLSANQVHATTSETLERAAALRMAVEELGRMAEAARHRLNQAARDANGALRLAAYSPGHATSLRSALAQAEESLRTGRYDRALAEAEQALRHGRALEEAYQRHLAEEARRRREAEERRRREQAARTRSSGGGGGWGGSSGGGGNWGSSSSRSSGGGGNWGKGGGGRGGSSGGGGKW